MGTSTKPRLKNVQEINKFLSENIKSKRIATITGNRPEVLTLEDIRQLKESKDYIDGLFKTLTQTLRN